MLVLDDDDNVVVGIAIDAPHLFSRLMNESPGPSTITQPIGDAPMHSTVKIGCFDTGPLIQFAPETAYIHNRLAESPNRRRDTSTDRQIINIFFPNYTQMTCIARAPICPIDLIDEMTNVQTTSNNTKI